MSHIKLAVFSKDRAAQLDLLLRSIAKNAPVFSPVVVLYKATTPDFKAGYDELMKRMGADIDKKNPEYPDQVIFVEEGDFREDTLTIVAGEGPLGDGDLVCFATDDSVIYREFKVPYDFIEDLVVGGDVACLSLRIGAETTTIETYFKNNLAQKVNYNAHRCGVVYWRHHDYNPQSFAGYCYSLDAHIFWKAHILDLMGKIPFDNPNSLEAHLSQFSHKPGINNGYMAALTRQCVVSSPVNSTSTWQNRNGDTYPQTPEYLNVQFLGGYRINLDRVIEFCNKNVNCTHYEINLEMEQICHAEVKTQ